MAGLKWTSGSRGGGPLALWWSLDMSWLTFTEVWLVVPSRVFFEPLPLKFAADKLMVHFILALMVGSIPSRASVSLVTLPQP